MNLTKDQESYYNFILNKMYKAASEDNKDLSIFMQIDGRTFNAVIDEIEKKYDIEWYINIPYYIKEKEAKENDLMVLHLELPIKHTLVKRDD